MQPDKSIGRTGVDGGLNGRGVHRRAITHRAVNVHIAPKRIRLRRVKGEAVAGVVAVVVQGNNGGAVLNIRGERSGVGGQELLRRAVGIKDQILRDAVEQKGHVRTEEAFDGRIDLKGHVAVRIDKEGSVGGLDVVNHRRD